MTFNNSRFYASSLLLIMMLLTSCTHKIYTKQESVFIVFKTPSFKHADLGFIYTNKDEVKVEFYGSGQALVSLEMTERSVCMSFLKCMSTQSFNEKILSRYYPKKLIENIFRKKPIFNGLNYSKKRNGFTQTIRSANRYNIEYSVLDNIILFRDTINHILIKVKRMQG